MIISGGSESVLEKFVGRNHSEFKVIEGELAKIIKMIRESKSPSDIERINKSDSLRTIERQLTKFFGVKSTNISWKTSASPNAYTYCKTWIFTDDDFKETAKGRKSNASLKIYAVMHSGLVTSSNMNEKELMAILLHEIGHNFYASIIHTLSTGALFSLEMILITALMDKIGFNQILFKIDSGIRSFLESVMPKLYKFYKWMENFNHNLYSMFPKLAEALISPLLLFNLISPQYYTRYLVEKHADSFAVDHGYGKELSSALNKLVKQEGTAGAKSVYKIPGISWMYDLFDVEVEIVGGMLGIYPSPQNRIRSGLDRLKKSLNDPELDKNIKIELKKQIDDYEKYYNDYYLKLDENDNKRRVLTYAYRKFAEGVFNGKMDIRELFVKLDPNNR